MERVPPAPVHDDEVILAARMPAGVRLGTSSWSFPGWRGLVYAERAPTTALASQGLAAYAHHPLRRTVGLDRTFYETPDLATFESLAAMVPPAFRFMVKAHQACTRPHLQADGATHGSTVSAREHGAGNERFLHAAWARDQVVGPAVQGLGASCGPILFQFPAFVFGPREAVSEPTALLDRLHAFLAALPRGPRYAVEVRNDSLLRGTVGARLVALLRDTDAVPALGVMPSMPGVATAVDLLRAAGWRCSEARLLLVRWLLGHQLGYQQARERFEPFHTLAAPDVATRHEIAALVAACAAAGGESFVIINNKAEGSAPRSIPPLAASIQAAMAKTTVDEAHAS